MIIRIFKEKKGLNNKPYKEHILTCVGWMSSDIYYWLEDWLKSNYPGISEEQLTDVEDDIGSDDYYIGTIGKDNIIIEAERDELMAFPANNPRFHIEIDAESGFEEIRKLIDKNQ
jgi:hypothetical protein